MLCQVTLPKQELESSERLLPPAANQTASALAQLLRAATNQSDRRRELLWLKLALSTQAIKACAWQRLTTVPGKPMVAPTASVSWGQECSQLG